MHLSRHVSTLECSKYKCVRNVALNTVSFVFVTQYVGDVRSLYACVLFSLTFFFITCSCHQFCNGGRLTH